MIVQLGDVAPDIGEDIFVGFHGALRLNVVFKKGLWNRRGRILLSFDSYSLEGTQGAFGFRDTFHKITLHIILLRAELGILKLGIQVGEQGRGRTGLVVVVDEIDFPGTSIGRAVPPVIDEHIADIESTGMTVCLISCTRQRPVSSGIVSQQTVVKTSDISTN